MFSINELRQEIFLSVQFNDQAHLPQLYKTHCRKNRFQRVWPVFYSVPVWPEHGLQNQDRQEKIQGCAPSWHQKRYEQCYNGKNHDDQGFDFLLVDGFLICCFMHKMGVPFNIKPTGKKKEADNKYIRFENNIADLKTTIKSDQRSRDRDQDDEDEGTNLYPDQGPVRFPDVMHLLVLDHPEHGEEHKAQDVVIELQHHISQDFPDADFVHFLYQLRYGEIKSQKGHGDGIDTVRQGFDP